VTKSIFAILTMSMTVAACGGSGDPEVSAAAAPAPAANEAPATAPAAPAPAAEIAPAPQPARNESRPRPPVVRQAPPRAEYSDRAPAATASAPRRADVPEYREFTLPAGMTLPLELKSTVASDVSEVEDTVRATLRRPVMVDGQEVLPAGTEVSGTVTEAEKSGRVKGRAKVAFQFTSVRFDGERLPMRTEPIEQLAEATKGEDAAKIGVGAGAGAVIGGLLGGKAGAAKGAVLGGAAGTGAVMATRGKEVRLEPGAELTAKLTAPLSVRVRLP